MKYVIVFFYKLVTIYYYLGNCDENGYENGDDNCDENVDENGEENGDANGDDTGDENGDDNGDDSGDAFLNLIGARSPRRFELKKVRLCRDLFLCTLLPRLFLTLKPCLSSDFLSVLCALSGNSPFVSRRVFPVLAK